MRAPEHTGWCLLHARCSLNVGSYSPSAKQARPFSTQLIGTDMNVSAGEDFLFKECKHHSPNMWYYFKSTSG